MGGLSQQIGKGGNLGGENLSPALSFGEGDYADLQMTWIQSPLLWRGFRRGIKTNMR